jgi:parvulin-like peptidyl-prolyl isomerase
LVKKKNVEKAPRQYTKRQISHLKKQKRRQNLIFYGGISIIVVVIVIVLVGLYIGEIRPYGKTALKIYDREFSVRYYMDAAKYEYPIYNEYYGKSIEEVLQSYTAYPIQQNELIRRGAKELGIVVDDNEVKPILKEAKIYINDASLDLTRADLLYDRLYDEHFSPAIPETADQVNIKAMFLESEEQVDNVKARLSAGENFTVLAEDFSLQSYSKNNSELGWHIEEWLDTRLGSEVPYDYAFSTEPGTLSGPVYDENLTKSLGYWIVNVLDRPAEDQAELQVILVGSDQEAQGVLQRLDEGEDFGELAKEVSQDEESREQGGDLGVMVSGSQSEAFDNNVFSEDSQETGIIGPFSDSSVSTTGGYWLIEVVDKAADQPIEEDDKNYLANIAYNDWVTQLYEDAKADIDTSYLTAELLEWMTERLIDETSE